jgi:glycosyltransferase involved in cell wall biosynthesis
VKLLVFAFVPPPHHGQSAMVKLMLDGFGGDQRKNPKRAESTLPIQCYHVDARFATDVKDMGSFRPGKAFRLVRYIAEALWCRFRYGADVLYYVPAMPQKATILRDIVILLSIRRFFRKTIFHWHAAGLGQWIESDAASGLLRYFTRLALRDADLAISPAQANVPDLRKFWPKQFCAVPNGISDPCPEFEWEVLPVRQRQFTARSKQPTSGEQQTIKILYMGLCFEEKGLLDTVKALHLLKNTPGDFAARFNFTLTVGGKFLNSTEEEKFWRLVKELGLERDVSYAGFLTGDKKKEFLTGSDLFCFPTYFVGESFGIVIVEAMAFGLPIVTTRWRTIPEFFPDEYPGLADIRRPDQVAACVLAMLQLDVFKEFREKFINNFTIDKHLQQLQEAILSTEASVSRATRQATPIAG